MLMRRNVAAGIGSNEQGEYCTATLQQWIAKSRDINRLLYFTLLLSSTLGRPGAPPRSDPVKLHAINVSQLLNCEDSIRLH